MMHTLPIVCARSRMTLIVYHILWNTEKANSQRVGWGGKGEGGEWERFELANPLKIHVVVT